MPATDPSNCADLCGFGDCPPPNVLTMYVTVVPWQGHPDGCDGVDLPPPFDQGGSTVVTQNGQYWQTPNPVPGQGQFRIYCNDPGNGLPTGVMVDLLDDQGNVVHSYPVQQDAGGTWIGAAAGYCRIGFLFTCDLPPQGGHGS